MQPKRLPENVIETDPVPFAAQEAAEKYPVTLYTFDCDVCKQAEALLAKRGIPFATVIVSEEEGAAKLKALTGKQSAPVLQVGEKQMMTGFNATRWEAMLDEAGYPKTAPPARQASTKRAVRQSRECGGARGDPGAGVRRVAARASRKRHRLPQIASAGSAGEWRMKLVSWNVNSLNIRLPRVVDWLAANAPDVVCLQETKVEDAKFPIGALADAGYAAWFTGQKSYNGVALLVRRGLDARDITHGIDGFVDEQKRVIAATVEGVRIVCDDVPNGQAVGSDIEKLDSKDETEL